MKQLLCFASALMIAAPCFAQTVMQTTVPVAEPIPVQNNSAQPIEITATKTVEWLRNEKKYVARENVIVKQGKMTINADLLTADYREGAASSMEIWQLAAEGHVQISDGANTAYGDHGVYDVTQGIATLTGQDLKLISPDQTVTATDRMEYHANTRQAKAIGNAKVVRPNDTLTANTITAFFKDETATPVAASPTSPLGGNGNLDRLEADGNVVIKTPTETLHGQKAVYRADINTAELSGKVKIERGPNVLEGTRAEVNLKTNVSKLFGSEKEGGRVRGVFFPGSEKKPDAAKPPAANTPPSEKSSIYPVPAAPETANVSQ